MKDGVKSFEVVLLNPQSSTGDYKKIPRELYDVLAKQGKYWPKAIFTDATLEKSYGGMTKSQLYSNRKRMFRKMKSAMREKAEKSGLCM